MFELCFCLQAELLNNFLTEGSVLSWRHVAFITQRQRNKNEKTG